MYIPEGAAEAAVLITFLEKPPARKGTDGTLERNSEPPYSVGTVESTHSGKGIPDLRQEDGVFPLIQRPGNQGPHSGQISLPGGKREKNESLMDTAIRETEEEIGLNSAGIEILGSLTPLYIPVSGFGVYPFVGWYSETPGFRRDPLEVEEILFYDLKRLTDPEFSTVFDFHYNGKPFQSPGFKLEDRIIWGATAMILMELTEHLLSRANQ